MRRHDQAVDLLIAVVGEREYRPVVAGLARAYFDPADNGVGPGRGRDLNAVALGALALDGVSEIDRGGVGAYVNGLDRMRGGCAQHGRNRQRGRGTEESQEATSELRRIARR